MTENWNDILTREPIDLTPRSGFEAQLREGLIDEWHGRPMTAPLTPSGHDATGHTPRRGWLLGAAAAAVLIVGGVVVATRPTGGTVVTPATDVPPTTLLGVAPSTSAPPLTAPAPTIDAGPTPVPSTNPPITSALPTTPPTTPPPTTAFEPEPVTLTDWPAPSEEPGNLGAVPRLLPSIAIDGVTRALRREVVSAVEIYDYVQTWLVDDGPGYVEITTNLEQADGTPTEFRTPVDIERWDEAYFTRSTPEFVNLVLVADGGVVRVSHRGLDRERVVEIASSMERRPAGDPGWDIDETGLTPFNEFGDVGNAFRTLRFDADDRLIAELTMSAHPLNGAPVNWIEPNDIERHEIDGQVAIATNNGSVTAVSWSLDDGTGVLFGYRGPIDEALELARSITTVDEATWEAQTAPNESTNDGCDSLFC